MYNYNVILRAVMCWCIVTNTVIIIYNNKKILMFRVSGVFFQHSVPDSLREKGGLIQICFTA